MQARYFVVTWYVPDDDTRSDEEVQAEMMARCGFPMIEPLFGDEAPVDLPERPPARRHRPVPRSVTLAEGWRQRVAGSTERALSVAQEAVDAMNALHAELGEAQPAVS